MRTILAFLLLIPSPAFARRPCRVVVQKNVVVQNDVVAVPFATPLAVPVAVAMPGSALYSAGQHTQQYSHPVPAPSAGHISSGAATPAGDAALFAEFQAFLEWRQGRTQAQSKPSLIAQTCGRCHTDNTRGAGVAHFVLSELQTCEGRLKAIRAVLAGKMPKGTTLDPDAAGKILEDLAGDDVPQPPRAELAPPPTAKTQDVPPAEPVPPKPEKSEP